MYPKTALIPISRGFIATRHNQLCLPSPVVARKFEYSFDRRGQPKWSLRHTILKQVCTSKAPCTLETPFVPLQRAKLWPFVLLILNLFQTYSILIRNFLQLASSYISGSCVYDSVWANPFDQKSNFAICFLNTEITILHVCACGLIWTKNYKPLLRLYFCNDRTNVCIDRQAPLFLSDE